MKCRKLQMRAEIYKGKRAGYSGEERSLDKLGRLGRRTGSSGENRMLGHSRGLKVRRSGGSRRW